MAHMTTGWSRRGLLRTAAACGAAAVAASLPAARPGFAWPLGVQLWSVNDELARDVDGTLRRLGELGFREIELAGLHGRTPAAFRAAAMRATLRPIGAHYAMADLLTDPARCIGEARDVGARWLIVAAPKPDRPLASGVDWLVAMRAAMTAEAWQRNADALNGLATRARAAGLMLAYHNHPIEFAPYDGRRGIDILLAATDPALVKWELDVAWATAGGDDPVALLHDHRDRIRLLHAKALKAKPAPGAYGTNFATGIIGQDDVIDWHKVIAAARGSVEHVFIEQEPPHLVPVMTALARCRDGLGAGGSYQSSGRSRPMR